MHAARCLLLIALALLCGLAQAASSYTFRSDSYAWETAANALAWDRSCTSYPGDDDKATITFTGGFKFTFAGTAYTSVRVLTNGGLQFGTDTGFFRNYTNTALPAGAADTQSGCVASATTNVILAYWTDLDPSRAGSGGVTWEQKGTAPNRYVVVSWNGVYQYNTSTPYTFQIILFENGEFKYQYGNANASGSNATIGVQVSSSDTTQYSYNSGYNANGSAIRWFVPNGTPTRRAEYRFDEWNYSGRVGEVADSSGNSNNGVRVGNAATSATAKVCRSLSIPADTTSASHAVDTLLDVNSGIGDKGAVTFWYDASTAWNNSAAMLLDATTSTSKPFFLVRQSDGSLRLTVTDSNGLVVSTATPAQSVAASTWKHIGITWNLAAGTNQSTLRIYLNGVQIGATTATTSGSLDNSIGTLFVGDNRSSTAPTNGTLRSANGLIDEMRVYNYEISALELNADMASLSRVCPLPLDHIEVVPSTTNASTCSPTTITLRACSDTACAIVLTSYVGTVNLSTSTSRGTWALSSGSGSFSQPSPGSGQSSYTFSSADQGVARLTLSYGRAQAVKVTAADSTSASTSTTTADILFSDNAFVWAEDLANKIDGSNVVVAGRPHDLRVSLVKKDSTTANCGVATDYSGTHNLKLWRTDKNGSWAMPSLVNTTVTPNATLPVPTTRPSTNNLSLVFSGGVANVSLTTTDIGKYTLSLDDDSLTYVGSTLSGSVGDLIVRPFTVVISGLTLGGIGNPAGSNAADAFFGRAGAAFSATVGAYRWASGADSGGTGVPDANATLAQVTAGGLAPTFNSSVTLTPDASLYTPAGGTPGSLLNNVISGFSGGSATVNNLSYSEVGSFALKTSAVVGNFLSSGIALDAVVFKADGAQKNRIGRFVPAGFTLAVQSITHRSAQACNPISAFTYLGEPFQTKFTLTAVNAQGAPTLNYDSALGFAKLNLANASKFALAGADGATRFVPPQLVVALGTGTQTWVSGVASTRDAAGAVSAGVSLVTTVNAAANPTGPFNNAAFGIAPVDDDQVGMTAFDLDADPVVAGNDRTRLGQIPLLHGRLRLQNALSAANRTLKLPLTAQSWNGAAFVTNALDSCTRITAANLSFGNFRKTLTAQDAVMDPNVPDATVVVNPLQPTYITLAAPGGGRLGSMDVAVALGSTPTDSSCLKTAAGWVAAKPATAGANLASLRGAWCGAAATSDPSARATWGLYRGSDGVVYQRENY